MSVRLDTKSETELLKVALLHNETGWHEYQPPQPASMRASSTACSTSSAGSFVLKRLTSCELLMRPLSPESMLAKAACAHSSHRSLHHHNHTGAHPDQHVCSPRSCKGAFTPILIFTPMHLNTALSTLINWDVQGTLRWYPMLQGLLEVLLEVLPVHLAGQKGGLGHVAMLR